MQTWAAGTPRTGRRDFLLASSRPSKPHHTEPGHRGAGLPGAAPVLPGVDQRLVREQHWGNVSKIAAIGWVRTTIV